MQPQERGRGGVGHGCCARQTRWAPRPGQAEDGQGRSEALRAEAIERGSWTRRLCQDVAGRAGGGARHLPL